MRCLIHLPNGDFSAPKSGTVVEYVIRCTNENYFVSVRIDSVHGETQNILGTLMQANENVRPNGFCTVLGLSEKDEQGWVFCFD